MVDLPKSVDHRQRTAPIAHHQETVNAPGHPVYPTSCLQSIWTTLRAHQSIPRATVSIYLLPNLTSVPAWSMLICSKTSLCS